jgi:MarR family transcriptional regulator, lower aerobic nicotinate degradation pathway regulator
VSSAVPETPIATESLLPEELLASPGFLLARVGGGMKMRVLDELEQAGCPGFQYGVLALLREGPAQTQARIADVLGVDRSQLVGELDELEASGLIKRMRDPLDRRRHMVEITAKGKKELVKLRGAVRRIEDEYLAPLDPGARKQLHDLLLRIAEGHDARFRRRD